MGTISIPQEPPPLIGPIFHQPPEPHMSSPNSICTLSSPSVSYATTTASPRLTKNQSRSTDTTPQSSKATVFQTVSGASPSIPTNHKPMHYSQNKHNGTLFNGSTPPPSVPVSALSSRPPNEFFRHLAQSYTPSHLTLLATFNFHRQRPSQPTTTTSPQTIPQRATTNSHHHMNPHHLCSDSRSQKTNLQLLQ